MVSKETCKGGAILNMLKGIRRWTDKIEFVEDMIIACAPKQKTEKTEKPVRKLKRQMSGYNCYLRVCAAETGDFKKCLKDKGWAKLSEEQKIQFKEAAKGGCPIE